MVVVVVVVVVLILSLYRNQRWGVLLE